MFDMVEENAAHKKESVRRRVIYALRRFKQGKDPVSGRAAELLSKAAATEASMLLRRLAVESLEQIVKAKPTLRPKLIEALKANTDSADKSLRQRARWKLERYEAAERKQQNDSGQESEQTEETP
jgi:vesicle coat complex subunit